MAYTALYRKFRPQTFESVIGKGHRENLYGEDFCQSHQLHEPHGGRRALQRVCRL